MRGIREQKRKLRGTRWPENNVRNRGEEIREKCACKQSEWVLLFSRSGQWLFTFGLLFFIFIFLPFLIFSTLFSYPFLASSLILNSEIPWGRKDLVSLQLRLFFSARLFECWEYSRINYIDFWFKITFILKTSCAFFLKIDNHKFLVIGPQLVV